MGFWANKIYPNLPQSLQNTAVSAYGLLWNLRRFGGVFAEELPQYKSRESLTVSQWEDFQTKELRRLLLHAYDTVPYYHEALTAAGFNRLQLQQIELADLSRISLLEKNTLRQHGTTTLLSDKPEPGGIFFASSGSTGTPTQILFSRAMHQRWSAAFEARIRHWAGLTRHDPRGMIGGRRVVSEGITSGPFYRYNYAEKQVYFSAYHIAAAHAGNYLQGIKKYGVQYMTGYAMSNYFLARFFEETGLEAPVLKAVLPSSEKLTAQMRATFAKVYHCKAFDAWSGVEACGLVSECEHGRLHVSPDVAILEFLHPETGQPVGPGEIGEVVCTGFLNYDQPLIRYRIGDLMRLGVEPCPCGREMPVIQEIIGRTEDTVIGADGREMVRFHGIFVNIPTIIEGQIIQHDYTDFEIRIVSAAPLTPEERTAISQRMQSQLGTIKLTITEVASISRGANGKFKAVISHVKRAEISPIRTQI